MAFDDTIVYDGAIAASDEGSPNLGNSFYIQFAVAASRPTAGNKGVLFFATDTKVLSYDDGAAWQTIGSVVELTTADDLMTHDGTAPKRLQNAFSKTVAPGATDDSAAGYAVGSVWIDTTNDKAYVCVDATATAAVWTETTATPQFTKGFVSSEQTITSAGTLTIAHSLGAMPKIVQARLICKTASLNYAVNDEVIVDFVQSYSSTEEDHGVQAAADATNLVVRFGAASACMSLLNKTTGVKANVNNVDWRLILRAYA